MRNSATVIRRGAELPPDLAAALDGSEAGAIYAVKVRKLSPEDAAIFLQARAEVQAGLADLAAGRVYSEEEADRILDGDDDF